jgi:hypothetical protein
LVRRFFLSRDSGFSLGFFFGEFSLPLLSAVSGALGGFSRRCCHSLSFPLLLNALLLC